MNDEALLAILHECATAVAESLTSITEWRAAGERDDQYGLDLVADPVACGVLIDAGLGVLSEESGRHHPEREICVVVDPVDGSTNASRRIPWYATSLAAVDGDGVRASLVVNQATGVRYHALRGGGAYRNDVRIRVSDTTALSSAVIAMNGHAPIHFGWGQYRALGAAALDMCLVAEGAIDGYLDCTDSNHGVWDYLGAMLIVAEAGGVVTDVDDRELLVLDHAARRAPVVGGTAELHDALITARRGFPGR